MRADGRIRSAFRSVLHRAGGHDKPLARRVRKLSAVVMTTALLILAVGSAIGRWKVIPVPATGESSAGPTGSVAVLEPIPAPTLKTGDHVFVRSDQKDKGTVYRVTAVKDSWKREFEVLDAKGEATTIALPGNAWRVSHSVPYLGVPFSLLVGPIQAVLLVLNGVLLVGLSESRRHNDPPRPPAQGRRRDSGRAKLRVAA
jgi:hypothetical protein